MKKIVLLFLCFCLFACTTQKKEEQELLLAAAASLESVLSEQLIPMFEAEHEPLHVEATYDSSGKLQKQIVKGLEADLFFSADDLQMERLKEQGLIDETVNLLENQLVLIKDSDMETSVNGMANIQEAEMIAIGDPESVPAGKYAKQALEQLQIFDQISRKCSLGSNVTEVLNWVSAQSAEVGLVYATDAKRLKDIEIIETVDENLMEDKIVYPIAILNNCEQKAEAELFLAFLQSEKAKEVFEDYGFSVH